MRVAIVNDLAVAREVLRRVVLSVPGHSVAWAAADGDEAVALAAADPPDVVLMDLVMPRLDGAEATRRIMRARSCPILVVTSTVGGNFDLVYRAMGAGALDAVETPGLGPGGAVVRAEPLIDRLAKLGAALRGDSGTALHPALPSTPAPAGDLPPVVAIGASTGGPDALAAVLRAFPPDLPAAVLIAQHIAAEYAPGLAVRLGTGCRLPVRVARDGDAPAAGEVLLAATNDHLELGPDGRLRYTPTPRSAPYRPSADVLFTGLAARGPRHGVGVLLTGMGTDGAAGLLALRRGGWHTVAQDRQTCVVYGMPKAAADAGAAAEVLPLDRVGPAVVARVRALSR
ncbi:MAG: chemotaxis-specific protein-glutamate methyltransferase CheB [Gemmataceae bacterium]|nr:chemotaxis-specific protein-glutamate methyltransferase CheB [Gemmataceae bacterium]